MRRTKPRTITAKRCGAPKGGGGGKGGGGVCSRGILVGYQQILSQLVEVKGVPINFFKKILTFLKVEHCKGGGSTVGGSGAAQTAQTTTQKK